MSAWPSNSWTERKSAPPASRWLAKAWRSTWGETFATGMPARPATSLSSRAKTCRDRWPSRRIGRKQEAGVLGGVADCREPCVEGRAGGSRHRHHAFLGALAAYDQEPPVISEHPVRQADEFADPHAGGIEQARAGRESGCAARLRRDRGPWRCRSPPGPAVSRRHRC
jgi:hypothetical protein